MIKKISVRNYQSLYNVEVELGKFTVLYGNSDVGKSAFYRAIRGLLVGEVGDDFISVETNRAGVSIKEASGAEVVWLKSRGKSSTYVLFKDGVKAKEWKRARGLPVELSALLKMEKVSIDGDTFYPNLRGQFDPLFLLFESSSKRARVLGSLVSNFLLQGIRVSNTERNRNEADVRAISSLAEDLERKMEVNWQALADKAAALDAYAEGLKSRTDAFKDLEGDLAHLAYLAGEDSKLATMWKLLVDKGHGAEKLAEFAKKYEELFPAVKKYKVLKKIQSLQVSTSPPVGLDRLFEIEALLGLLMPLYRRVKELNRDIFLSGKELDGLYDDIGEVSVEIGKLKALQVVTCPHCGKEFQHDTE